MNKRQLEAEKAKLAAEEKQLKHLKGIYKKAADDIAKKIEISNGKISVLLANWDELTDEQKSIYQSQIYQRDFQQSLQKQINGFLKDLNSKQYKSVDEYLKDSYKTGYIGAMYDIAGQGIPIVTPIDQKQVVKAMTHDTKLSKRLYTRLGEDVDLLKKRVANNISRGIATADSYANIARNISNGTNVSINRTMTIARTEGHRIQVQATSDAQHDAKDKGADVVKQWDSTLDGKTRPHHRQLDGQIRELDEPFEVDGMKVKYPSGFGIAAEDINCRCALLQRAKWNLGEEELETLKERAAYFGLDKTKDFEDYKKKYLNVTENIQKQSQEIVKKTEFIPAKSIEEAQKYAKQFCNDGFMSKTFKGEINYKGVSIDNANDINLALTKVYNSVGLEKISGIKAISPTSVQGKKVFSSNDAVAAYSPIEHGIFLNKDILKNAKAVEAYNKESEEAWNIVMNNIEMLQGKTKETALRYQKAGRALVGDGSVHDYIVHEMGHHVQWTLLDVKTNNSVGDKMHEYAPKISGYATASKGEYLAESFAAYMKGEIDILDPEYVAAVKSKVVEATVKSGIIQAENEFVKIIPDEKFIGYALNPLKDENKAKAFEMALGYTQENYQELKEQIMKLADESKFVEKGDSGYGMRYEYILEITGANGKKANVLTAWIQQGKDKRLTSVYVTNKKVTE